MVDFRGGPPPAQGAAQLPPSLLQMAQGQAPQVAQGMAPDIGDTRGGGGPESDPMGNITAGAPPAYNPGTAFGGYNAVFDERAPSSTGGWFKMDDYLDQAPTPMEAAGTVPLRPGVNPNWTSPQRSRGPGGNTSNALSTNNWRLLPQGFNDPDHFMINGNIVSRAQARGDLLGYKAMGQEGGGFPGYWPYGGGTWATPTSSYGWASGPIGGLSGWSSGGTGTY